MPYNQKPIFNNPHVQKLNKSNKTKPISLTLIIMVLFLMLHSTAEAKVIHKERSLYRNIIIEDNDNIRCLKFDTKTTKSHQSCFNKGNPQQLVFNYTKMLFASLSVNPHPKRILIIGLGGGTMSNALHQIFPKSTIDNVEIDQAVIDVARQYFGFFENDKVKSYAQDGRIFIKRAILKKQQYDWIILDAFNGDYIPEHLLTQEFLTEAKKLLSENGILSANTFTSSKLYQHESATYHAVFGDFYQIDNGNGNVSNRVILVSKNGLFNSTFQADKTKEQVQQNIKHWGKQLAPYAVDMSVLSKKMHATRGKHDWPKETRILTDQFSPANLLN